MLSLLIAEAVSIPFAASAQSGDTLKFSLTMPFTGSQALYVIDQVKGAQWAAVDINGKGGINGKKLEIILIDIQADPQLGINATKCLTRDLLSEHSSLLYPLTNQNFTFI